MNNKIEIGLIILCLVIISCSNGEGSKNVDLIKAIDSIDVVETIKEVKVDSSGNIIDRLSLEIIKKNENGDIIFRERKLLGEDNQNDLKSINYYRNNKNLFYSKFESSKRGLLSVFESWEKNNKITHAISVEYYNNEPSDTIFINYNYLGNKTVITSKYKGEVGNVTELFDNDFGKVIKEIEVQYGDTLKVATYDYSNKKTLAKKIVKDYKKNLLTNMDFDDRGNIVKEEVLKTKQDSLIKLSETIYKTNLEGQIIKSITTKYPSKEKTYVLFNTVVPDSPAGS